MRLTREKIKAERLLRPENYGRPSSRVKLKQELHIWCIKTLVIENLINRILELLSHPIYALRLLSTQTKMR